MAKRHTRKTNVIKISTKEELIEQLEQYKYILNRVSSSHLKELIDLKSSVVDYSDDDMMVEHLAELELYKKIAVYNIYNRAIKKLNENKEECNILGIGEGKKGIHAYTIIGKEVISLFDYDFCKKEKGAGSISLYKIEENDELRNMRYEKISKELNRLYDERNSYNSFVGYYGKEDLYWTYCQDLKISKYEQALIYLEGRKGLTEIEQKQMEVTDKIRKIFLEEYGLREDSFDFIETKKLFETFDENDTYIRLQVVKNKKKVQIKKNIRYI